MSALRTFIESLARPPEEARADDLRQWRSTFAGATAIAELKARQRTRAVGVVETLRIDPREGHGSVEATIFDGTGELVARWLGRSSLAGITLGTGLMVEGVPGVSPDGKLVVLNPEYELLPSPEHG